MPILLLGAGGHARACIDVIEQEGRYAIAGLVGLPGEVGGNILGYPVLGSDKDLTALLSEYKKALVTVGQIKTPEPRTRLFDAVTENSCAVPCIISPNAYVSDHATLGDGTIVMHGAVVNAGAEVGKNCILNSQSLVEHDAVISDHCHIATSVSVNSGVHIGKASFVGSGTVIRQSTRIGENCVIGMGQRVLADCDAGTQISGIKSSS